MRSIDYFDKRVQFHPDRPILISDEAHYSYGEMHRLTHRLAGAMLADGLRHQEPVAIMSPNHGAILTTLLGLWRAGAVWIPVNTRNALDANIAYLNYVRAGWLFYHSSLAAEARQVQAQVPSIRKLICLDTDDGEHPSLDAFMLPADAPDAPDLGDPVGNGEELTAIIATGGTTGPAKGVRIMNRSWGALMETIGNLMPAENPVCLATAPLTHAAGPVAMAAVAMGATISVLPGFDAEAVMRAIERDRVTHMFLPPTALYTMLSHPRVRDYDYSSLRYFLLAGSPVSPDKLRQAVEIFGECMCQSYGQTECHMIATWLPPHEVAAAARGEHPERLASCGKASYSVRIELMDDDGNILPTGEVGEIVARGGIVGGGYFEMPEATAEATAHGWHHTGDVGRRDADGYYYIVDRKKDMVVTGGFNVYSAEVEGAIMELEAVAEAAIIGLPHDHWGEQVHAVVVARAPVEEAAIIAHVKARLGSVKAPKTVAFVDEIPRTAAGKMDKKALRQPYWGDQARMVN
ncbi:class I adenylate-forming enzyme family protein [Sphingobium nicotianae]|uniref:AMP-binding protein n=1 Tax=Sphingobium nicotianae TaxID=2782607 RepID=A0A9X1IQZ6_9SPHN|nr:AMP-binding protein [Sphingobium nicotianae]MBT2187017.1 AMP-binding protein [Sphingobium nicotianae]